MKFDQQRALHSRPRRVTALGADTDILGSGETVADAEYRLSTVVRKLREHEQAFKNDELAFVTVQSGGRGVDHGPTRSHLQKLIADATELVPYAAAVEDHTEQVMSATKTSGLDSIRVSVLGRLRHRSAGGAESKERGAAAELFRMTFGAGTLGRHGEWLLDLSMLQQHKSADWHNVGSYGIPVARLARMHAKHFDGHRHGLGKAPSLEAARQYFVEVTRMYSATEQLAAGHLRQIDSSRRSGLAASARGESLA